MIIPVNTETPSPVVGVGRPANPEERLAVLGDGGEAGPPVLPALVGHHRVLLTPGLVAAAARHCGPEMFKEFCRKFKLNRTGPMSCLDFKLS